VIIGFLNKDRPLAVNWADEMEEDDRREVDEKCTKTPEWMYWMYKKIAYAREQRRQAFEDFREGFGTGQEQAIMTDAPARDPEHVEEVPDTRTTTERMAAVRAALNKAEDVQWLRTLTEETISGIGDPLNLPTPYCDDADAIEDGETCLIRVQMLRGSLVVGNDAQRRAAQVRRRLQKKMAARGMKVVGICLRVPGPNEPGQEFTSFEMEVVMNQKVREWIQGLHEVYYGEPGEADYTKLWGVPQPHGHVGVRLKGAGLTQFLRTLHYSHPQKWTYRGAMLHLQYTMVSHNGGVEARELGMGRRKGCPPVRQLVPRLGLPDGGARRQDRTGGTQRSFCATELVAVVCGESLTGWWNRSWIIFYFRCLMAARMFFAIVNARKIPAAVIWRPGFEAHPYEMKFDVRGMPVVRASYDFRLWIGIGLPSRMH